VLKFTAPPMALADIEGIGALKTSTFSMLPMESWSICTARLAPLDAAEAISLPSIVTIVRFGSKPRTRIV
jgi:hypothetical protein